MQFAALVCACRVALLLSVCHAYVGSGILKPAEQCGQHREVAFGVQVVAKQILGDLVLPPKSPCAFEGFLQAVKNGAYHGQKLHGDVGHVTKVVVHLNTSILHDAKRGMKQTGPTEFLQFLHPHSWPSPSSKDFSDLANNSISELVKLWGVYSEELGHSVSGAQSEWPHARVQVGKVVDALRRNKNPHAFAFWRPIMTDRFQFLGLHFLLRCALAQCPSSVECERLFPLLNRINRFDRRNLTVALLEQLLVVARDAELWLQYHYVVLCGARSAGCGA